MFFNKESNAAYQMWLDHTKDKYYGFNKSGSLQRVTMYYDALKDHHHSTLPPHGLAIAFYAKPQAPEFAELLYRERLIYEMGRSFYSYNVSPRSQNDGT